MSRLELMELAKAPLQLRFVPPQGPAGVPTMWSARYGRLLRLLAELQHWFPHCSWFPQSRLAVYTTTCIFSLCFQCWSMQIYRLMASLIPDSSLSFLSMDTEARLTCSLPLAPTGVIHRYPQKKLHDRQEHATNRVQRMIHYHYSI